MTDLLKNANCKYKQMVLWSYLKALENTEAWPLEGDGNKMSVQELMVLLGEFEYDKYDDPHPDNDPCTDHSNCATVSSLVPSMPHASILMACAWVRPQSRNAV